MVELVHHAGVGGLEAILDFTAHALRHSRSRARAWRSTTDRPDHRPDHCTSSLDIIAPGRAWCAQVDLSGAETQYSSLLPEVCSQTGGLLSGVPAWKYPMSMSCPLTCVPPVAFDRPVPGTPLDSPCRPGRSGRRCRYPASPCSRPRIHEHLRVPTQVGGTGSTVSPLIRVQPGPIGSNDARCSMAACRCSPAGAACRCSPPKPGPLRRTHLPDVVSHFRPDGQLPAAPGLVSQFSVFGLQTSAYSHSHLSLQPVTQAPAAGPQAYPLAHSLGSVQVLRQ